MTTVTVFVGLDYHAGGIQVCVLDAAGRVLANQRLANSAGRLDEFVRGFGDRIQAAVEACTGSAHLADELATRFGWDIRQAHPGSCRGCVRARTRRTGPTPACSPT